MSTLKRIFEALLNAIPGVGQAVNADMSKWKWPRPVWRQFNYVLPEALIYAENLFINKNEASQLSEDAFDF
jgi:hypothetical protein